MYIYTPSIVQYQIIYFGTSLLIRLLLLTKTPRKKTNQNSITKWSTSDLDPSLLISKPRLRLGISRSVPVDFPRSREANGVADESVDVDVDVVLRLGW